MMENDMENVQTAGVEENIYIYVYMHTPMIMSYYPYSPYCGTLNSGALLVV